MKHCGLFLVLVLVAGSLSCDGDVTATGETVALAFGEEASVANGAFTIRFAEVEGDSRCPEGVDCIWAGNGRVALELSRPGEIPVTQSLNTNRSAGPGATMFEGREIGLVLLLPDPPRDEAIPDADYSIELLIRPS